MVDGGVCRHFGVPTAHLFRIFLDESVQSGRI